LLLKNESFSFFILSEFCFIGKVFKQENHLFVQYIKLKGRITMDRKAQSALEYLMTYGWALVVIAIIIAALVFLLGQSTTTQNCTMSPAAGALGYIDHAVTSDGNLVIKLRNDTAKTITDINATVGGDFGSGAATVSTANAVSAAEMTVTKTGNAEWTAGQTYSGIVTFTYNRSGITHTAVANCTGKSA